MASICRPNSIARVLVPNTRTWCRLRPRRRIAPRTYLRSRRAAMITVEPMVQNAKRKYGVMTEIEKNLPSHQRHAVERVMAQRTSVASACLVDMRFDSYRPHRENML